MIKNKKVKKLLDENGLQIQNFSMINRLKKIIDDLHKKINDQVLMIQNLKRDSKTTKINEMEVEIQHLNDQNKRLILIIEQMKKNTKSKFENKGQPKMTVSTFKSTGSKKSSQQSHFKKQEKQDMIREMEKQKKFEIKYYQLLTDFEKLKKQIIKSRILESTATNKKRKSQNVIDKNCLLLQKNFQYVQKISQQNLDLEAQNKFLRTKITNLEGVIKDLQSQNKINRKQYSVLEQQLNYAKTENQKPAIKMQKPGVYGQIMAIEDAQEQKQNRFSLEC